MCDLLNLKHGLVTLRTAVRALGPRVVDRRITLGKQLAAWKADLIRDLGGDVSTQQAAIIELAVKTKLLLDSIDAWLLTQPSLVNLRKSAPLPVVREGDCRTTKALEATEAPGVREGYQAATQATEAAEEPAT